ncbi:terpene synthase family protein [Streptomyces sp. NPDC057743]|uniref:terpene synthase family protein n=1 Tax=Streptomyces sp. NPDC057743 TaxID=3346236 RepID=UPI0036A212A9
MDDTTAPHQLLVPGESLHFPALACSTTAKVNPDYPTIYEHNAAWVRAFLPFSNSEALGRMLAHRYPLWESMVYPVGLPERVAHSSCVTSLMFEVDDVALLQRGLFDDIDADWESNQHPYGRAFHDIWSTLCRRMPEQVYRRYREGWQNWFAGAQQENEFRAAGHVPSIETYLEVRRSSVGLRPYLTCLEYVLDLDLTRDLEQDEELAVVKELAVEHAMLVNDVYSARWECFNGDYFNVVAVLMRAHGTPLQEAVDELATMADRADARLTDASAALRRRHASAGPKGREISSYLDGIGWLCAGNYRWSCETSRYNGPGYGWNGLRDGVVTLHPERTIIDASQAPNR